MGQQPAIEERTGKPGQEVAGIQGEVRIARRVITRIAAAVAREVEGLHLISPRAGLLGALTNIAGSNGTDEAGVRATLRQGRDVTLDLWVSADFGIDIPAIVEELQLRIQDRIRSMTGFRTRKIRVNVIDVVLPHELDR